METPPPLPAPSPEYFAAPLGPRPGEVGVVSAGEARGHAPGPRWYRLPAESWAMIRAEYLAGATAKQLAVKWGVSPTSIYRHACQDGFTKARRGEAINLEAVTRFAAEAAGAEARAAAAARAEVEAQEALARRAREEEAEADPEAAAQAMLRRAAGAALAGKLERAQALLKLAEGLGRLVAPPTRGASPQPGSRFGSGSSSGYGPYARAGEAPFAYGDEEETKVWSAEEVQALRDRLGRRLGEVLGAQYAARARAAEARASWDD